MGNLGARWRNWAAAPDSVRRPAAIRSGWLDNQTEGGAVPLFMDIHSFDRGVAAADMAKAHLADLRTQGKHETRTCGTGSMSSRPGRHERIGAGRPTRPPRSTVSPGFGLAAVGVEPPAHLTAGFCVRMRGLLPAAAVKGSSPQRAEGGDLRLTARGQLPLPVAAWYCSTTLAGMRPRSLTAMPWSFAQVRMSPLR